MNGTSTFEHDISDLLSQAAQLLKNKEVVPAFNLLGPELTRIWGGDKTAEPELLKAARAVAKSHEIFAMVQQDPYSHRAFHKPRGYPGDAVMMDFVYSGVAPIETTDVGKTVFSGTTRGPMGLSVLFRRQLLTAYINQVVVTRDDFRILSVASGHCREIENSLLVKPAFRGSGKFVALDQDPQSCELVAQAYSEYPVEVIRGSVKSLLTGELAGLGHFDLVYSAGLFDYLDNRTATLLTDRLAALLRPKGKLLLGNFSHSSLGRGYMDLLLDWQLIYRSEEELTTLFGVDRADHVRSFLDPHANVAYAEWAAPPLREN